MFCAEKVSSTLPHACTAWDLWCSWDAWTNITEAFCITAGPRGPMKEIVKEIVSNWICEKKEVINWFVFQCMQLGISSVRTVFPRADLQEIKVSNAVCAADILVSKASTDLGWVIEPWPPVANIKTYNIYPRMKFRKFSANGALRNSGLIITICKDFQFGNEVRDFGQLAQHPIMKLVFDFLLLSFPIWLSVYIQHA